MELLIAGKRSKEIATALHVSVPTVGDNSRMVFYVSSEAQLDRFALSV